MPALAKQINLFGGEDEPAKAKRGPLGVFQQKRLDYDYRTSDSREKRRETCRWVYGIKFRSGKNVYKCRCIGISHSTASDIRLKSVCRHWEEECKVSTKT
jgi:hypothetical protein